MPYRLVILDFDGTLADSATWFIATLNELAPRFGYRSVTDAEIARLRSCGNREIIRFLQVPRWRMPFIAAEFRRRSAAAPAEAIRLFDGIAPLLHDLRARGLRLAVVSSNGEKTVRRVLGPDLGALIDAMACGSGLFGKARKFRRLMRDLGIPPGETLCIGDEERDIEAAHEAGADALGVTWGYANRDVLERAGPCAIVDRPDEIGRWLAGGA